MIKKDYKCYGGMHIDELVQFAACNYHTYELVPIIRKRKFYLDYDHYVLDVGQTTDEHERAFKQLHAKCIADAESICGPGRAVLSGSWGKKNNFVRYSLHLVRRIFSFATMRRPSQ